MSRKYIFFLSLLYTFFITLVTYVAHCPLSPTFHNIKEVLCGYWGYGWDGMHYTKIATEGYIFPLQAFFPLYPILIIITNYVLPLSIAQRINVLLLPITLLILTKLASKIHLSKFSVVALLSFPTAFFLQANYTETLFILLSGATLLSILHKRYLPAVVLASLASATKISGVALGLLITLSFLVDNKTLLRKPLTWIKAFSLAIASNLGLIAYFVFLSVAYKSPVVFFKAQAEWSRNLGFSGSSFFVYLHPLYQALLLPDPSLYRRLSEVACVVLAVVLLIVSRKKLCWQVWLYSLFIIVIPLSTGSLLSFNRLILLAFPLLLFGYSSLARYPKVYMIIAGVGVVLQIIGMNLFLNGVFVG